MALFPQPVYLDYHATTPVDPRVLEAMLPYFSRIFGNAASSSHAFGWEAARAVQRAREQVAACLACRPGEIVFTSGATESNNLALKGVAAFAPPGAHFITTTIEHHAVLDPCALLERQGFVVTRLGVDGEGRIRLSELEAALRPSTVLVSVIAANNEIGTIQDMAAVGALTRARGVLLHSDATQALAKMPIAVDAWNVDLLSLSGHKIYGPKGIGALYVRQGTRLACQQDGGGHEGGRRSGTLNVTGIVGLGAACELALAEGAAETTRVAALRDRLHALIAAALPDVRLNGSRRHRLPHNLHLTFPGVDGETLMLSLRDVACSSGSACASQGHAASHVLAAIGLSADDAHASLRFGLGRFTTEAEIDFAAAQIVAAVHGLRALAT